MKEEWIAHIWQNRLVNPNNLYSFKGQKLEVLSPGLLNSYSGPDFNTAKIRFRQETLVGRVEIHCKTSDFLKHHHSEDPAYQNLVAHVVWQHDLNHDPAEADFLIELSTQAPPGLLAKIKKINARGSVLACADYIHEVPGLYKQNMIEKGAVARLKLKSEQILNQLNDGEVWKVFLGSFGYALGAPVNSLPMDQLLKSFNLSLLPRLAHQKEKVEALLFGQAGLIQDPANDNGLFPMYCYLKEVHYLRPLDPSLWKTGGMRQANFPCLLIARFAGLIFTHGQNLLSWTQLSSVKELKTWLNWELTDYWKYHHAFGKDCKRLNKGVGDQTKNKLLLNCFVPFLFAYGNYIGSEKMSELAFTWLEELPAEDNHVVRQYKGLSFKVNSALQSQGLIGLERQYCKPKKCLNCEVANHRLRGNESFKKFT